MHKVLLIGATGKLGQFVLKQLLLNALRFETGLLLRNTGQYYNPYRLNLFEGDILDDSLQPAIRWADVVINCSGFVSYKNSDKEKIHLLNVRGVENILKYCILYHKKLIHTSSAIAYGSSKQPLLFQEDSELQNVYRGEYSKSKFEADSLIKASEIPYIILRPGTLISTLTSLYKFYQKGFIADLRGGASFAKFEDVAAAYINAMDLLVTTKCRETFNLGGNNLTFQEVFNHFKTVRPLDSTFIRKEIMAGLSFINDYFIYPLFKKSILTRENYLTAMHFTFLDSSKALKQLNYKIAPFEVSVKSVLEATVVK